MLKKASALAAFSSATSAALSPSPLAASASQTASRPSKSSSTVTKIEVFTKDSFQPLLNTPVKKRKFFVPSTHATSTEVSTTASAVTAVAGESELSTGLDYNVAHQK